MLLRLLGLVAFIIIRTSSASECLLSPKRNSSEPVQSIQNSFHKAYEYEKSCDSAERNSITEKYIYEVAVEDSPKSPNNRLSKRNTRLKKRKRTNVRASGNYQNHIKSGRLARKSGLQTILQSNINGRMRRYFKTKNGVPTAETFILASNIKEKNGNSWFDSKDVDEEYDDEDYEEEESDDSNEEIIKAIKFLRSSSITPTQEDEQKTESTETSSQEEISEQVTSNEVSTESSISTEDTEDSTNSEVTETPESDSTSSISPSGLNILKKTTDKQSKSVLKPQKNLTSMKFPPNTYAPLKTDIENQNERAGRIETNDNYIQEEYPMIDPQNTHLFQSMGLADSQIQNGYQFVSDRILPSDSINQLEISQKSNPENQNIIERNINYAINPSTVLPLYMVSLNNDELSQEFTPTKNSGEFIGFAWSRGNKLKETLHRNDFGNISKLPIEPQIYSHQSYDSYDYNQEYDQESTIPSFTGNKLSQNNWPKRTALKGILSQIVDTPLTQRAPLVKGDIRAKTFHVNDDSSVDFKSLKLFPHPTITRHSIFKSVEDRNKLLMVQTNKKFPDINNGIARVYDPKKKHKTFPNYLVENKYTPTTQLCFVKFYTKVTRRPQKVLN